MVVWIAWPDAELTLPSLSKHFSINMQQTEHNNESLCLFCMFWPITRAHQIRNPIHKNNVKQNAIF